jgi:hypothetical protein
MAALPTALSSGGSGARFTENRSGAISRSLFRGAFKRLLRMRTPCHGCSNRIASTVYTTRTTPSRPRADRTCTGCPHTASSPRPRRPGRAAPADCVAYAFTPRFVRTGTARAGGRAIREDCSALAVCTHCFTLARTCRTVPAGSNGPTGRISNTVCVCRISYGRQRALSRISSCR